MPEDRILLVGEVAEMFDTDPKTIQRWTDRGELPFFRTPGGHRRFYASQIEPLVRAHYSPHPVVLDLAYMRRHRKFSLRTFGPTTRAKGVMEHIEKEFVEILAEPEGQRGEEWVDVIILGLDGAIRDEAVRAEQAGEEPDFEQIITRIWEKLAKNEKRKWPDWRLVSLDHAIEHVRGEED